MAIRVSKNRIDLDDMKLRKAVMEDYGETLVTANSGTAYTIDITAGNVFEITLTGNCTFTFSNPSPSGSACTFTLVLKQGAGSNTVVWPAAVDWDRGLVPTISSAASAVDIFTFLTTDVGTRWYGFVAGQSMQ